MPRSAMSFSRRAANEWQGHTKRSPARNYVEVPHPRFGRGLVDPEERPEMARTLENHGKPTTLPLAGMRPHAFQFGPFVSLWLEPSTRRVQRAGQLSNRRSQAVAFSVASTAPLICPGQLYGSELPFVTNGRTDRPPVRRGSVAATLREDRIRGTVHAPTSDSSDFDEEVPHVLDPGIRPVSWGLPGTSWDPL
jgi:hypothetical protein